MLVAGEWMHMYTLLCSCWSSMASHPVKWWFFFLVCGFGKIRTFFLHSMKISLCHSILLGAFLHFTQIVPLLTQSLSPKYSLRPIFLKISSLKTFCTVVWNTIQILFRLGSHASRVWYKWCSFNWTELFYTERRNVVYNIVKWNYPFATLWKSSNT